MTTWTTMDFNQLMEQLRTQGQEQQKEEVKEVQWRCQVFQGDTLVLDHAQNDYNKVFRFTMQAVAELHNQNVTNFKVHIQDRSGNLYFFAIGEQTPIAQYKKATKP